MASWTVFTSRLRTSRVSETPNRLNSRAKEINNNKKLRNEDWYSEMRFVRNWTRDSKPVTRDLLGSSRTFDSENKRPTRSISFFKWVEVLRTSGIGFVEEKQTNKNQIKVLELIKNVYFTKSKKRKIVPRTFSGQDLSPITTSSFAMEIWETACCEANHRQKNRNLKLIEDSFGLTSNAVSFLWQKDSGTFKKDNGQRQVSSIDRPSCLSCAIFWEVLSVWRCRCSVYLNIENKQFYKPAPLVTITWRSV